MLTEYDKLAEAATDIKATALAIGKIMEQHRARLTEMRSHAEKQHQNQVEIMNADHKVFLDDVDELLKSIGLIAIAIQLGKVEPEKETADAPQEG
jgi:hypothetical protein